jgi:hypothetical protein
MSDSFEAQGFAVVPAVLTESECQSALDAVLEQRRSEVPLTSWFTKDGALFVQPPVAVLESLVALRVHLDDGGPESGTLRLVPGSHRFGRLRGRAAGGRPSRQP